jgi:hydrogenase expression/formation protein HypE
LSDCNPLSEIIANLFDAGITPHFMRDATRGGLATVMCELAELRSADIDVDDSEIVVLDTVRGVCELYGFDPLYLANEGKFIAAVASQDEDAALAVMRSHPLGRHAARIGRVLAVDQSRSGRAVLQTAIGGSRLLRMLSGEQLPRIC